jgi:hypothetical protein
VQVRCVVCVFCGIAPPYFCKRFGHCILSLPLDNSRRRSIEYSEGVLSRMEKIQHPWALLAADDSLFITHLLC